MAVLFSLSCKPSPKPQPQNLQVLIFRQLQTPDFQSQPHLQETPDTRNFSPLHYCNPSTPSCAIFSSRRVFESLLSSIENMKSWYKFYGDGFAIRVPAEFQDITEPEEGKYFTLLQQ